MRTDTLFYAADLRCGIVAVPADLAPAAVWLTLAGQEHPVPAWPLTPAAHASLWLACVKLEDRWRAGDYPQGKMEAVWERWARIEAWAVVNLSEGELMAARAVVLAGAAAPPRPAPPPLGPLMVPFRDWPPGTHCPGTGRESVKAARKRRQAKGR